MMMCFEGAEFLKKEVLKTRSSSGGKRGPPLYLQALRCMRYGSKGGGKNWIYMKIAGK